MNNPTSSGCCVLDIKIKSAHVGPCLARYTQPRYAFGKASCVTSPSKGSKGSKVSARNGKNSKCLSSWWLNQPIWKICSSKWVHLPQGSGWTYVSCHHLVVLEIDFPIDVFLSHLRKKMRLPHHWEASWDDSRNARNHLNAALRMALVMIQYLENQKSQHQTSSSQKSEEKETNNSNSSPLLIKSTNR